VNAVQERAAAQKVSKEAERRIAKLRRDFTDQFNSAVVAHSTGADREDPNAQPQLVKQVSEGDYVKLKSVGRNARGREICGSRVPRRIAASANRARQRHGNFTKGSAAIFAKTSACGIHRRAAAE